MADKETIELLVDGGKASPGPTTAPKFSAYKLNVGDIFKQINEKTSSYAGIKVPVKIIIDKETKSVEIKVGVPPVSSLIKKELGIAKAKLIKVEATPTTTATATTEAATPAEEVKEVKKEEKPKEDEGKTTGDLTMEQCVKIAKMKQEDLLAKDLRASVKQVVGTCVSMMGITIESKSPKEILKEIEEGKWDKLFAEK
jgi:large subunit ribosomal protein L11